MAAEAKSANTSKTKNQVQDSKNKDAKGNKSSNASKPIGGKASKASGASGSEHIYWKGTWKSTRHDMSGNVFVKENEQKRKALAFFEHTAGAHKGMKRSFLLRAKSEDKNAPLEGQVEGASVSFTIDTSKSNPNRRVGSYSAKHLMKDDNGQWETIKTTKDKLPEFKDDGFSLGIFN